MLDFNINNDNNKTTAISEDKLSGWTFLRDFQAILKKVAPSPQPSRSRGGPPRQLVEEDYLSAILFTMFNPVIDSVRGLSAASDLGKIREQVTSSHISLGSFSEAQHVFGYERIETVFRHLVEEDNGQARNGMPPVRLVDSSVFSALTRMNWAEWRHRYNDERAIRLHLKFNVLRGEPAGAIVTKGRHCERKALEDMISEGEFYVGDRYYGRDYLMHQRFTEAGCGYLFRLSNDAAMTVEQDFELTEEDRAAGVVFDRIVRLGWRDVKSHASVRVIRIEKEDMDEPIILATNELDRDKFSADLAAEVYRSRWDIELFFRWIKCILGRRKQWHWLAESEEGVTIQLYVTLIAALLLSRRMGKLPGKRTMEMLNFFGCGLASEEELERHLSGLKSKKSS